MKTTIGNVLAITLIVTTLLYGETINKKTVVMEQQNTILTKENIQEKDEEPVSEARAPLYNGKTKEEIINQIDTFFTSTLKGTTTYFVEYALEVGVDPYLGAAIVLEETGCTWGCSTLVRECNNIGGQKGTPSCNGGSYRSYPTLDAGIKGFLDNLSKNYVQKGLTTAETINTKYAESKTWASKINRYIQKLKAN